MEKSKEILTKLARVKHILTILPDTRDNDRVLIDTYWRQEKPLLFSFQSGDAVSRAFLKGELSMPDDITRARRRVQQQYPELRGTKWVQKRRTLAEADVKDKISKALGGDIYEQLNSITVATCNCCIYGGEDDKGKCKVCGRVIKNKQI